jgi:hypothetical protein
VVINQLKLTNITCQETGNPSPLLHKKVPSSLLLYKFLQCKAIALLVYYSTGKKKCSATVTTVLSISISCSSGKTDISATPCDILLTERLLNKGIQAKTEESLLYTDRLRNKIFQSFNKVLPPITELLSMQKKCLPKQKKLLLDLTKANPDINKFLNTWKEWKHPNAAPILLFDKK